MKPKFLTDRALLINPEKILVVCDIHLGLEYDIQRSGIAIPSQTERHQERILRLAKKHKVKHIVVMGDIKNEITGATWQEKEELPKFFKALSRFCKVSAVKGNHDGDIERYIPSNVDFHGPDGFRIGNFCFLHGHAWPSKEMTDCEYVVMAHLHPMIELFSNGVRHSEACWIRAKIDRKAADKHYKTKTSFKEVIVMPAFNPLLGGVAINSKGFKPHDPIINNLIDLDGSDIFLQDGTHMGRLKDLKNQKKK